MPRAQTPLQPPKARRPRSHSRYKRSETARLLKGVADAGHTVRGLEVDLTTGVLRVLVDKDGEPVETVKNLIK